MVGDNKPTLGGGASEPGRCLEVPGDTISHQESLKFTESVGSPGLNMATRERADQVGFGLPPPVLQL